MSEWMPVVGWEGRYEVSSSGLIRKVSGDPIGQFSNDQGYMLARLSNRRAMVRVHRVVAEAFVSNPNGLPFVNHIDNDRANNSSNNLEWCTQAENLAHADRQGRMQRNYWQGRRSPNARLTDSEVRDIRSMYKRGGTSLAKLGQTFGISKRSVGRCINLETYHDV